MFPCTTEPHSVPGIRMSGAIPLLPLYSCMACWNDLSFRWLRVFFIAGTAPGVGVDQSYQSRTEMRMDGAAFVLPPTPSFYGYKQLENSLYFDKCMY